MQILVIKLSSLGDLFHALPAVHMLRLAYPDSNIDWVTQDTYKDLVRSCFDDVDQVMAFPRRAFLQNSRSFLTELRAKKYDLILDLQGLLKSAFVARAARGKKRIGPSFHREGSHLLYDRLAGTKNQDRHAVDQIMDVVDHLGLERSAVIFPLSFPPAPPQKRPHIVVAPASRWPSKNWPTERFASAAHQIQKQWNASISIIGAPGEEAICNQVANAIGEACNNHAGKTSLPEMGSIIASADVLLANDSGPVHMAAALAVPSVVVFGPTDPVRIGPYGNGHHILLPETPCSCGRKRVCEHPETACIKQITVSSVLQAVQQILSHNTKGYGSPRMAEPTHGSR